MSYYHTARAHVRALKNLGEDHKRRAERRAELANVEGEQPVNYLRLDGRSCKLIRSEEQYRSIERTEGMIAYNGQEDNLIDRFDGRALLDFYRDPVPSRRQKSEEELELQELVQFESFRDLVTMLQTGHPDRKGIALAEQANVELRALARATAKAEAGASSREKGAPPSSSQPGVGNYGAVGFSYTSAGLSRDSDSDSDSDASVSSDEERDTTQQEKHSAADRIAEGLGLSNFSSILRHAERQEEDEAQGRKPRKRRMFSRKKAAERARRMAGQGVVTLADKDKAARWRGDPTPRADYGRRSSPSYDAYRRRSESLSRSRSRSPQGHAAGHSEYFTEFRVGKSHRATGAAAASTSGRSFADAPAPDARQSRYLDAMPSRADPAGDGGPVSLPASAVTLQGVRREDAWRSEPARRDWNSRSSDDRHGSHSSSRACTVKPEASSKASQAQQPGKETPMERMKRLRAAQLNRTFQGQVLSATQKRAVEERERLARAQLERAARLREGSPPRRARSPEYSPPRYRSRSPEPHYRR